MYFDASTGLGTSTGDGFGTGSTLVNGKIAQGQAFYVVATGPNPTLTINEAAKIDDQQTFFREDESSNVSHLYINLKQGDVSDQAIVMFTEFGSDDYEAQYDAIKLQNEGMFNFSTLTKNGRETAINNMSSSFCGKTIALNLENADPGNYTLEFPQIETLFGVGSIQLVDKFLNKSISLNEIQTYEFSVTEDANSSGAGRFDIAFNRADLNSQLVATTSTDCNANTKVILSKTQKGASYSLVSVDGVLATEQQTSNGADVVFEISNSLLKDGENTLYVNSSFSGCESKAMSKSISLEHYSTPAIELSDVSTCAGESTSIKAIVDHTSVTSFNWYDAHGNRIKGFTSEVFETDPVLEETAYSVSVTLKNGCEGPRNGFVVYPVAMAEPQLLFENNTLFVDVVADSYEWTKNGEVIPTNNERFLVTTEPGMYQVTCKTAGCARMSRVFGVTETGDGLNIETQYHVFPNPTSSGEVNLKMSTTRREAVVVKVIDVLGREHYVNTFDPERLSAGVRIEPRNEFRAGVYYMLVKQGATFKEIKFVVKE
jgi:hypothetical protein